MGRWMLLRSLKGTLASSPPVIFSGALSEVNWGDQVSTVTVARPEGNGEDSLYSFDALPDLEALARARGVSPAVAVGDSPADFWPEGESVEDFIAAATEGRYEEESPDS